MSKSDTILSQLQKDFGTHIGSVGVKKSQIDRIPTGLFQFDLATGGGIPRGRVSIIYGAESSGKTTAAYLLVASTQRLGQKAVFVDVEGTYDPDWASQCGVDNAAVIVVNPDTAEQVVDVMEAFAYAEDVGLVVLDSIAAMITENEVSSDSTKMIVGGASMLVGKMIRKCVLALNKQSKTGHKQTIVFLNQTRYKIGVMYGDPETFPGGNALRFASSLTIRLYGKDKIVKEIHPHIPVFKTVSGIVKKWKVPIVARQFEYDLCIVPHGTLKVGQSPSWNTVANYLKQYKLLTKEKTGWRCMNVMFKTLDELSEKYESDPEVKAVLQAEVVSKELAHTISTPEETGLKVDTSTGEILE